MSPDARTTARTFYLNEQHELARAEKEGGGRIPQYIDINWAAKGAGIARSIGRLRKQIQDSTDPAKENHCFVLAAPVEQLTKASKDKTKAIDGKVFESTDFAEKHSRVFHRLGLDLINVADDGSAVVHMKPELMEQLSNTAQSLPELGTKEKSRWATIGRFGMIPPQLRIDSDWLDTLSEKRVTDAVIEFQPLLNRAEIDSLVRAIVSTLLRNLREAVTGTGTDFSGRQWVRGQITRASLEKIAQTFFSVQSLHSPLISIAAGTTPIRQRSRAVPPIEVTIDPSTLPVIGVVDTGIPADHSILSKYRRGTYLAPTSAGNAADPHGCFVSSRVVFGDVDYSAGPPPRTPVGSARYYDVNVSGISPGDIEDKGVYPALQAIVATAPDVRIFNMSFDAREPLDSIGEVKRSEALRLVQDLDNFIFQNDILVVIAAGNSPRGLVPSTPYPRHFNDPQWSLGHWARSFNSLTCGSFVARLSSGGVVNNLNWPSPFSRVGPGLCNSPKPDFSANGGNGTPQYQYAPGLGVWGLNPRGMWEDQSGTSFAAPLLARECAFGLEKLQQVCERGAQPFGVTVKAFLALTAIPPVNTAPVPELGDRTLGRGRASAQRLEAPLASSGVMMWQGVLEDDQDIARIQIPIPADWFEEAEEPYLKLVVAWDPPVNAAVKRLWATRDVSAKLKMHPDAPAHRTAKLISRGSYPLLERLYNLRKLPPNLSVEGDSWLIEIAYEQTAEYHPAMTFPPQQRVAFAAELFDKGNKNVSPQSRLQALSATRTMTRLTVPPTVARLPVILKTPV
jgi:hypothetical protein